MFMMNDRYAVAVALLTGCLWAAVSPAAEIAVEDDFEVGTFAPEWDIVGAIPIQSTGGADGTTKYAELGPFNDTSQHVL